MDRSRICSQLFLLQLKSLSRIRSFISLGEVQKLSIFIYFYIGSFGWWQLPAFVKKLLTSLGPYKMQQHSFYLNAEKHKLCFSSGCLKVLDQSFSRYLASEMEKREPWKMGCLFYFHYSSLSTTLAVHNSRALNLNPFTKQIIFISAWYGLAVLSRGRV